MSQTQDFRKNAWITILPLNKNYGYYNINKLLSIEQFVLEEILLVIDDQIREKDIKVV